MMDDEGDRLAARRSVGDCPRCGASIDETAVIIEYEVSDRETAYAECPTCEDVVSPR
ncbi:hypothetical protein Halru_1205 [Halovivax ruber XH-70]|uniref:DUF7837 domain-containing protein n=1 Tax=Halovivax ruber (strain DSM 18193 / JCM 13892 / XH-70) TaxID=797302 RepID=L0I8D0_HALRX|nr:hypothetical protein [Halovivax ruber]AGB15820.1 hypothetical protein Halru_1205 [Halovivax ruber XH-70]